MAQIDLYSNDRMTLVVTVDETPDRPLMVVWGTRVFSLDPISGDYIEQVGSEQAVSLPKMRPRPGIGATDGWKGWDKV
jgi:hypothetical protein